MLNKKNILIIMLSLMFTQNVYTEHVIEDQDTLDIFSYQIPSNYSNQEECPLLVAFHQWGGNQNSPYNTQFDEEAEERGWIFLSPFGGSSNNYNHQEAQDYTEKAILWLSENYSIDLNRIYMVGGSMGGASGSIYANNHLDPGKPMIAATASASGILDCERRAIEMDGNNSMIEWFGGNWDEVPFEYHRNSAVYFADSTQSMHYNLQYTPLYLDFGITEPHRNHAEDLYALLQGYNQNMWIDTEPTGSHGYSVIDEYHACNWLSQHDLQDNPDNINLNLDEPSRAYWIEAYNQINDEDFIRIHASRVYIDVITPTINYEGYGFSIDNAINTDSLIMHILDPQYATDNNIFKAAINLESLESNMRIGFSGKLFNGNNLSDIKMYDGLGSICINLDNPLSLNYTIENDVIWIEENNWSPSSLCDDSYFVEIEFYNDIDLDGIWTVSDIIILIDHIVNGELLNDTQIFNGDADQNQTLDILDIILIINIILES